MTVTILVGDTRERLKDIPDGSIQCCVTSPPYMGLRDYGVDGQIGLEPTLAEYIAALVDVFREVRRVLRDDGVCFLNLGDSYVAPRGNTAERPGFDNKAAAGHAALNYAGTRPHGGLKTKDLMMVPARVAIALVDDGWYLRSDIIWSKPNPMPESVQDRPTSAHEHIFLLSKSPRYFYDAEAVRTPRKASSLDRLSQDAEAQAGSDRANGGAKTNGTMKAVARVDKQRGHSRRHAGFNDRWDGMSREEQQAGGANLRNVWHIATRPFSGWTPVSRQIPVSWDEADDDTMRTPSPDCPMHAWSGRSDPIRVGDECAAGSLNRTSCSGGHRAPRRADDSAPIDRNDGEATPAESWGSLPLLHSQPAMPHSNGTSKTGHVPATSQPCTPSGQTADRIDDTSVSPAFAAPHHDTPASSIETADSDDHPSPDTADGTVHTFSVSRSSAACTCSYHKTVTESITHFAVFPPDIPRLCIKAGSQPGDTILDPFLGSGTTALVADQLGRHCIGIELNESYAALAERRIHGDAPLFTTVDVA